MKGRYLKKLLSIILSIAIVSQIITIGTIAQEAPQVNTTSMEQQEFEGYEDTVENGGLPHDLTYNAEEEEVGSNISKILYEETSLRDEISSSG